MDGLRSEQVRLAPRAGAECWIDVGVARMPGRFFDDGNSSWLLVGVFRMASYCSSVFCILSMSCICSFHAPNFHSDHSIRP